MLQKKITKRARKPKATATIHSFSLRGLDCSPVEIEVDIAQGLPNFIIVGLPDAAVSEARDRVRSAIKNSGYQFPRQRVTVNLAPAHTKKVGSMYDLPIAVGILVASGEIAYPPNDYMIGELALDGRLRPVRGALPVVEAATSKKSDSVIVPADNVAELAVLNGRQIFPVHNLRAVVGHCNGKKLLEVLQHEPAIEKTRQVNGLFKVEEITDMADIVGQHMAKRACEIAAAGGHNILMSGTPGIGKTMLARAMAGILPDLTESEIIEATKIHSVAGKQLGSIVNTPAFRDPHHSASTAAMVGGGHQLLPGEISLAHCGILFLDELPEFRRDVLEALRQPLEEGAITVTRASGKVRYLARCLFVAAQNPCPCGYAGVEGHDLKRTCICSPRQIANYAGKISGPLLDRIDIKVRLSYIRPDEISGQSGRKSASLERAERSAQVRQRVQAARRRQLKRQQKINGLMSGKQIRSVVELNKEAKEMLDSALQDHGLSMRGYVKTLKVARTIADLAGSANVSTNHISEALSYTLPMK